MSGGTNVSRVLVVDDHPDLCRMMVRLVELAGHPATCAADGQAALDAIRRGPPPSLVLLDIMMPGMAGWDVLRAVRADPALDCVSVVMCSALGDPDARRRAVALGAQDYLVKGQFGADDLFAIVTRFTAHPNDGGCFGSASPGWR